MSFWNMAFLALVLAAFLLFAVVLMTAYLTNFDPPSKDRAVRDG